MEYLQQLWNKVLVENITLLGGMEGSQVIGTKCKEVILGDKKKWWPSKKNKGKQPARYCGDARIKMKDVNPCERCVNTR